MSDLDRSRFIIFCEKVSTESNDCWLCSSGTVVEHLTHDPKTVGSNPATIMGGYKMAIKSEC